MADRTTQPADGVGLNPIYGNCSLLWNAVAPTKDQNSANTATTAGSNVTGAADGTYQSFISANGKLSFSITKPTTAYTIVLGLCFPEFDSSQGVAIEMPDNWRMENGTTGGAIRMFPVHSGVAAATEYVATVGSVNTNLWTVVLRWNGTTFSRYVKRGDNDATETTVSNAIASLGTGGAAQFNFGTNNDAAQAIGYYALAVLREDVGDAEAIAIRDNIWRIFAPEGGGVDAVSATGATASSTATPAKTGTGVTAAGGAMSSTPVIPVPTFTTEPLTTLDGSGIRASEAVDWTWFPLGVIGALDAITPLDGSGTTAADGTLVITGMSAGAGFVLATTADGGVYYEAGTAAL